MDNFTYKLFEKAKKHNDIVAMEKIYKENPKNKNIKYTYAKMLIKNKNFF